MTKKRGLLYEYGITKDARFVRAEREALYILALFATNTVWVFGFATWGSLIDQSAYPHFLGMPLWMVLTMLGGSVGYPIVGILITLRLRDCSLEATDPEQMSDSENFGNSPQ